MTVTTTPSNLLDEMPAGGEWLIQNLGSAAIYLARTEADCTTTDGVKISANEAIAIDEPARDFSRTGQLWARTASGTADVRLLRLA
jgi:hypothetical protein